MKYFFKKNLPAIVIAILILFIPLISTAFANYNYDDTSMVIEKYDIQATLTDSGDLNITETMKVSFDEDMTVLFRDIVYGKNDVGYVGNTSSFDTTNVKVRVFDDDNKMIYDSTNASNYHGVQVGYSWNNDKDELGDVVACPSSYGSSCESIFVRVRAGTYPTTTYEYTYTILGAVTKFNDVAELNWKFGLSAATIKIRDASVFLSYPNVSSVDDVRFYGHSSTNGKLYETTTSYVRFGTNVERPGETLEARVILPASLFPNTATKNTINTNYLETVTATEAAIAAEDQRVYWTNWAYIIGIFAALILSGLCFYIIYKRFDKEFVPEFQAEYYRDFPADYTPAEMGYLYNFKEVSKNDASATLLDLVVKGYITVDTQGQSTIDTKANYKMTLNAKADVTKLKAHEQNMLQWFFGQISSDHTTLTFDELDKYTKSSVRAQKYLESNRQWNRTVSQEGEKHDFFDKATERARATFAWMPSLFVGGGLVLFFLRMGSSYNYLSSAWLSAILLAVGIVQFSYLNHIKRRSKNGNEEYAKWKALRHFLMDFGKFDDDGIPSIVLWERYLVYATSFGIADLVEKQMRFKFKKMNFDQTQYEASPLFRYPYFYHYYNMRMASSFMSAQRTIAQAAAKRVGGSVGGGGMGGFGGGSSFGGGGGGVRGR